MHDARSVSQHVEVVLSAVCLLMGLDLGTACLSIRSVLTKDDRAGCRVTQDAESRHESAAHGTPCDNRFWTHTLSKRPFRPGKARKRAGTMPRSHLALSRQIDADDVPRAAELGAGKSTTTSRLMNDTKFLDNLKTYDKDPREHL